MQINSTQNLCLIAILINTIDISLKMSIPLTDRRQRDLLENRTCSLPIRQHIHRCLHAQLWQGKSPATHSLVLACPWCHLSFWTGNKENWQICMRFYGDHIVWMFCRLKNSNFNQYNYDCVILIRHFLCIFHDFIVSWHLFRILSTVDILKESISPN